MKIDVEKALAAMEKNREYHRKYYDTHKEEVKEYHRKYNKARRELVKQILKAK